MEQDVSSKHCGRLQVHPAHRWLFARELQQCPGTVKAEEETSPEVDRSWHWKASKRYNYFAVDRLDLRDHCGSTYGTPLIFNRRCDSELVAEALADAYRRGIERGRAESILESRAQ